MARNKWNKDFSLGKSKVFEGWVSEAVYTEDRMTV